ncbi:10243_t:CDS:2, partial [Racocetra persica]
TWGTRLQKRWKELGLGECFKTKNLDDCMTLCHDLEQYDPEFREQEELRMAVKRRAIAVHRAKVPKSHPDNGSDI